MVASKDDVYKSLSPYFEKFIKCIREGNEEQKRALLPEARAKAKKRTLSSLMNDLVSHRIREHFTNTQGIQVRERHAQTQIVFSSNYLMKTKQSKNKKLSFVPTQLAMDFLYQVDQLQLPNMPSPVTNLVLTYEWDETRTNINKISILCPSSKNDYHWELPVAVTTVPEIITKTETTADSIVETQRVRPKQKKNKKLGNKKGSRNGKGKQGKADQS